MCDDKALVDYALNYVNNGAGTGNKANAIVATAQDPDSNETLAQCQESGRDQGHATLDVTLMGAFCQMAQSQGTDLFTTYKALEMAEYVAKYNLKNDKGDYSYSDADLPFTAYDNGDVSHSAISSDARGTVRPSYELFWAYAQQNDKQARYCQQMSEWARRQNAYGEANATSTDELGYGTLMYMSADKADYSYALTIGEEGAATMILPFDATIPTGAKAYTLKYTAGDATVKPTEVTDNIPANTPVLVIADAGNYTFAAGSIWTKAASTTNGGLTGVFSKTIVPTGSYILTVKGGKLAFRKVDGTTNFVEANRAYLTAEGAPARLTIDFGSETTGVSDVESKMDEGRGDCFDLQGRRVANPRKGFYILNGKKIVNK